MTGSCSESDINQIKVRQAGKVAISGRSGVQIGAHVSYISPVGTSSSDVVEYSAVLTLDQNNSQVKPGMSATATVIIKQASGVTVSNEAITGSGTNATVQLLKDGKPVTTQVVVGLRGSSRSQI